MPSVLRRRLVRRAALALGWAIAGALTLLAFLRVVAHDRAMVLLWANSFTPYVYLPAYPVAVAAVVARSWRLAALAGAVVAAHVAFVVPDALLRAAPLPPLGPRAARVRIVSANLLMINERADELAREIESYAPDVILLQEVSPQWEEPLRASGIAGRYPHGRSIARTDSFGAAILSRLPLDAIDTLEIDGGLPILRATVRLDGGGTLRVYNVHPLPPRIREYYRRFEVGMAEIEAAIAGERGPLVVAGDFNFTQHAAWHRRLTGGGRLTSAHEACGRGLATTWPNGLFPLPPIRLDHVFVSPDVVCLDIREGRGAGSDHRPLIADLALPR